MIWGIISLILLLVVIGLVIWLLVRGNNCPKKSALNQPCLTTTDCNSGLVCSSGGGSAVTGITGATGTVGNICKVAFGGVCFSNSECAAGQVCRNGICTIALGTQGKACPCDVGFTCINNVCRAIVGQPCVNNGDCSTNICENNICVANSGGCTGFNPPSSCSSYSACSSSSDSSNSSCNSSNSSSNYYKTDSDDCHRKNRKDSCHLRNSGRKNKSRDSGSEDTMSGRSYDSLSDFYTCSDSNCSETVYSIDGKCHKHSPSFSKKSSYECSYPDSSKKSSYESDSSKKSSYESDSSNCSSPTFSPDSSKCSSKNSSYEECDKKFRKNCSSLNSDCSYSSGSHDKYLRRGVYVTNQQNVDQTLFTAIDQPIIDIVKTDKIYLLLANGNIAANSGINNVIYVTNKKIFRMVRFNNDIVGLDKKGKLFYAVKSGTNVWTWEHLKNFPRNVIFITSTNAPSTNLEVLTADNKAYLYTYSANWKEGVKTSSRKTCEPRYYGKDLTRYMDVNESTNTGKTNDGQKYRHVRAAGFYNTGVLVTVLTSDTFTHVRIIDNNAYFLFSQNC